MKTHGIFKGWREGYRYGFIDAGDGNPEVFIHQDLVSNPQDLRPGARVAFNVEVGPKGRRAADLEVLPTGQSTVNKT